MPLIWATLKLPETSLVDVLSAHHLVLFGVFPGANIHLVFFLFGLILSQHLTSTELLVTLLIVPRARYIQICNG